MSDCVFCKAGHVPTQRGYARGIDDYLQYATYSTPKEIFDTLRTIEAIYNHKNRSKRLAKKLAKKYEESRKN